MAWVKALGVGVLSAFAVVGAASPAKAIVFLQSVQGAGVSTNNGQDTWINPTPNDSPNNENQNITYPSNNAISWGREPGDDDGSSTSQAEKSRLTYIGTTFGGPNGLQLPAGPIDLGDLQHINQTISSGSAIQNVTLSLDFQFFSSFTNASFVENLDVQVAINETTNNPGGIDDGDPCPPPGGVAPCPDLITLTPIGNQIIGIPGSSNFLVFTPQFLVNGQPSNTVLTLEDDVNDFIFSGTFAVAPSPAPVGGIALLSLFSRRVTKLRKRLKEHHASSQA